MPLPVPEEPAACWPDIQRELRRAVSEQSWLHLDGLTPRELDGTVLVLAAPDATRGWIADRFGRVLQVCAAAVLGPDVTVHVVAESDRSAPRDEATGGGAGRGASGSASFNPKYTFEQFVIGDGNRFAHSAALAVAEMPGQAYNPLFIYGPPGLGKTHLLHSIGNYVTTYGGGLSARYTTAEAFTNHFVSALQTGGVDSFKDAYRGVDLLLIDDVQFLERKARTEEEFFHTFNALYEAGSQLVLTSDRLPRDMGALEDRLRERFESGLVADVRPPDLDTRLTILRMRVQRDGVTLADAEALGVIADRVRLNVRALEGALIRVVAYASLTGRPLDAVLAAEVLDGLGGTRPARRSLAEIQQLTAETFDLSPAELLSPTRTARIAWPRQVAMYLARELTDHSLPAIGRAFGGRNHATVLHAWKRTAERMASDPDAYEDVHTLAERLGVPPENDRNG